MTIPSLPGNEKQTHCGFIALIGAPNAGKSCLLNALVGGKVSIVSPKVQTTRTRITGIITEGEKQAVFIDTPGIFQPRRTLDRAMVAAAHDARDTADIVAIIVDIGRKDAVNMVRKMLDRMPGKEGRRIILVMNKIDLSTHAKLLPLIAEMSKIHNWDAVFMISATKDNGVKDVKSWILNQLPEGPFHYDPEDASDQPDALLASEITREKLFMRVHEELPYGLHVETIDFESESDGITIRQNIIISEPRHKGMVIGKAGAMLKQVGTMAREELEQIFECKVRLYLEVVVREGWDEKYETISGMGLDPSA